MNPHEQALPDMFMEQETTDWVKENGWRDLNCDYCKEHVNDSMMPPHRAHSACESGKKNHCTCDVCY